MSKRCEVEYLFIVTSLVLLRIQPMPLPYKRQRYKDEIHNANAMISMLHETYEIGISFFDCIAKTSTIYDITSHTKTITDAVFISTTSTKKSLSSRLAKVLYDIRRVFNPSSSELRLDKPNSSFLFRRQHSRILFQREGISFSPMWK